LYRHLLTRVNAVDMSLNKILTDSFKEHMEQNHNEMDITFNVAVLGKNFWPIDPPEDDFIVPTDIELAYDSFQTYYLRKHSGRRLTWLWNYSDNELRANYPNQKYILITSTYQMAVLLQYNNNDRLSLDKLATAIGLRKDSDLLAQVLKPLVKSRILINDEIDQYGFNPRASHSLMRLCVPFHQRFSDFRSTEIRVNLNPPVREGFNAKSSVGVNENRKYIIQATIVRCASI
jgi:cullin 1